MNQTLNNRINRCLENIQEIRRYIDINNELPTQYSNNNDTRRLGNLLHSYITSYKKQKYTIYNNPDCRDSFENLFQEYPKQFGICE